VTDDTAPSHIGSEATDRSRDQLDRADAVIDPPTTVPVEGAATTVDEGDVPDHGSGRTRWSRWVAFGFAGLAVVLLAATQIRLLMTLEDTRSELEATRSDVAAVEDRIGELASSVGDVAADVEAIGATPTPITSTASTTLPDGHLPRFVQGQQDAALGLTLGPVTGPDAYSGVAGTIDPADGTKRLWIVWAHWCPYCQRELPELSAMYAELRSTYPTIDIATVTTSIDPSQGNPLDDYLVAQEFPFPVIVDTDLTLASQLGASAFPFWVVTDGDGTVLLRAAGYLEEARVRSLAATLDEYGA
jgi:thiol-disulfide isomerase/thioredoxin